MKNRSLVQVGALLIGASSCSNDVTDTKKLDAQEVSSREHRNNTYEKQNGRIVQLFDVTITSDSDLKKLSDFEMVIVAGPKVSSKGQRIVSIRTTGKTASTLEEQGMLVSSHDSSFWEGTMIDAQVRAPCGPSARLETDLFPEYGEYETRLSSFNDAHTSVNLIGYSQAEYRPIYAINLEPIFAPGSGEYDDEIDQSADPPLPSSHVGDPVPTLVILGTYHAREWVSMAVAMKVAEYLRDVHESGGPPWVGAEEPLWQDLARTKVVVVPIVNPDGYQYTIDVNRDHRKNLGGSCTSTSGNIGIDLNRNHPITRWMESESYSDNACSDTYRGSVTQAETAAIENLYEDLAEGDWGLPSKFIATMSYHSYSGVTLYPSGIHDLGDGDALVKSHYNPDFSMYRQLFGDFERHTFKDYSGSTPRWMTASVDENILYTAGGDIKHYAAYGEHPHLAVTMELTSKDIDFHIECSPSAEQIVEDLANNQIAGIKKIIAERRRLLSTDRETSYVARELGELGPPAIARETGATGEKSWLMLPRWKHAQGPGSLYATVQAGATTQTVAMAPMANGIHYDLYGVPLEDLLGEGCIPCEVKVADDYPDAEATYGAVACDENDRCAKPSSTPPSGWDLGNFENSWVPVGPSNSTRVLYVGGGVPPWPSHHCALLYTVHGSPMGNIGKSIWLDAHNTSIQWPNSPSYMNEWRSAVRSRNDVVEDNGATRMNFVAGSDLTQFGFYVPAGTANGDLEIINPVVYCKKWDGHTQPSFVY